MDELIYLQNVLIEMGNKPLTAANLADAIEKAMKQKDDEDEELMNMQENIT